MLLLAQCRSYVLRKRARRPISRVLYSPTTRGQWTVLVIYPHLLLPTDCIVLPSDALLYADLSEQL